MHDLLFTRLGTFPSIIPLLNIHIYSFTYKFQSIFLYIHFLSSFYYVFLYILHVCTHGTGGRHVCHTCHRLRRSLQQQCFCYYPCGVHISAVLYVINCLYILHIIYALSLFHPSHDSSQHSLTMDSHNFKGIPF